MKNTIGRNIEILLIYEIKLDYSFPSAQFKIDGFSAPFRFERNNKWGGILMYIREDIPSRQLFCKSQCRIDIVSGEINLRKGQWFLNGSYNPHRNSISNHLDPLNSQIDEYIEKCGNFFFIGDF